MQRHLWFPLEYSKSHEWKRRQKILEGPQSFQCKALKCKFISTLVSNRDHRSRRLWMKPHWLTALVAFGPSVYLSVSFLRNKIWPKPNNECCLIGSVLKVCWDSKITITAREWSEPRTQSRVSCRWQEKLFYFLMFWMGFGK